MCTAIILAGGFGTRLRKAVHDVPKPMAPIKGKPFLEYLMDYWINQGVNSFILSVGYKHRKIIDYFGYDYRGTSIDYCIEDVPLGTGGGLLKAIELIEQKNSIIVINGDTFFEVDLKTLKAFHEQKNSSFTLALCKNNGTRYMGIMVDSDGVILSLNDNKKLSKLANGGVYLINPRALDPSRNFSGNKISLEDDILPALMARKMPIFGLEFDGRFIDIGIPEDYIRAASIID